jgi:O-acetyl-ADP-ribose deacetylase (regulator of RNase III)
MTVAGRIEAIEADITTLAIDAIVNAANSELMPGGGVDGAIRKRAGQELNDELRRIGFCAEGAAIITPGYRLKATWVIHTVAPVWAGRETRAEQEQTLARCYVKALELADEYAIPTIAFPGIGTGAYRWPPDVAARIAFDAVVQHLKYSRMQSLVTFCCFVRADRERYAAMVAALRE